ncbi:protein-glutamate O-methyltransferase CheR [Steroidobacter sp. S1-65]|uniref:Protein-glutamate O-methyltransferase CheR n=1 Tax=Steroidobacter gossypii TaxID=2805490 RepID=A0ABS1X4L6_9GAMM|nr:protein-glutamate O-methyltransferase CheR [Steroidobacter gossypii]MBM0108166.1 protein-glutamate O-methyltransferase CheR [Steroidobacter gossypii]
MTPGEHPSCDDPGWDTNVAGREAAQLQGFLERLFDLSGVDLSGYGKRALHRRLRSVIKGEGLSGLGELTERMHADPCFLARVLDRILLRVTTMFRDPPFFRLFRQRVVPVLRTYPYPRLWVAGCSTGQEAFSLAILLREEGMYDRCRIYATDINEAVLEQARAGLLPLASLDEYEHNYRAAGGIRCLSDYYTRRETAAVLDPAVLDRIAVFRHDLARDASFNEFHVIFCRNVLMYFDEALRERVHRLFRESLVRLGFLGLGQSEALQLTRHESAYEALAPRQRLYRRVR